MGYNIIKKLAIVFRVSLFLICTVGILSCVSKPDLPTDFSQAHLYGMIYDTYSQPVTEAVITLVSLDTGIENSEENETDNEAQNRKTFTAFSDINGRFVVIHLPKGRYRGYVHRDGYEAVQFDYGFFSRIDVLYLKLMSGDYLLEQASNNIEQGRWAVASEFLDRTEVVLSEDMRVPFLKAVNLYSQRKYNESLLILLEMEERFARPEVVIYIFIADLYQYKLGDFPMARNYLTKALEREYSHELYERYITLGGS